VQVLEVKTPGSKVSRRTTTASSKNYELRATNGTKYMTVLLQWSRGDFGSPQRKRGKWNVWLVLRRQNNCRRRLCFNWRRRRRQQIDSRAGALRCWKKRSKDGLSEPAKWNLRSYVFKTRSTCKRKADAARGHCSGRETLEGKAAEAAGPREGSWCLRWRRDTGQLSWLRPAQVDCRWHEIETPVSCWPLN
jgi:hypothetical protein